MFFNQKKSRKELEKQKNQTKTPANQYSRAVQAKDHQNIILQSPNIN